VSTVSYKKARTQEAEVEPCRPISASPLDDFARESACSFFLFGEIYRVIKKSLCA